MPYYGMIIVSVFMFGGCFALNDVYRKMRGSSLKISLESSSVGALAGLVILLLLNGFQFEFTWFTLLMAFCASLVGIGFTFCTFKALDVINLSLFSLFSMLGGMTLPFMQGILFYGEHGQILAKIVCFACICAALALTVTKSNERKKSATIYYIGIFVLNGMSGVLSKIFTSSPLEKTSAAGYSIWIAICTVVLAGGLWLFFFRNRGEKSPQMWKSAGVAAANGAINRIANYLLVIALLRVDASVQYPLVTGGVMIVSTLLCYFGEKKPTKKEWLSVLIAFVGMLALFAIPI
ncbi:MAG: hypothetical protein J6D30_05220 [Clostridia bacterium]|nr:hypothetical protein [Clostridia bacterium]